MGQVLLNFAHRRLRTYVPGGFEFVAARDIVEGHVLAMNKGLSGQKYIFSTEFMTIDALFDLYRDVTGQPKPPFRLSPGLMTAVAHVNDRIHRWLPSGRRPLLTPAAIRLLRMGRRADCGKARNELGYRPGSIAEAVRDAYDWFKARGMLQCAQPLATMDQAAQRFR
jgi:nucleoside-diphosphate-sugar epimerase